MRPSSHEAVTGMTERLAAEESWTPQCRPDCGAATAAGAARPRTASCPADSEDACEVTRFGATFEVTTNDHIQIVDGIGEAGC